jgi:hypothetical protein
MYVLPESKNYVHIGSTWKYKVLSLSKTLTRKFHSDGSIPFLCLYSIDRYDHFNIFFEFMAPQNAAMKNLGIEAINHSAAH